MSNILWLLYFIETLGSVGTYIAIYVFVMSCLYIGCGIMKTTSYQDESEKQFISFVFKQTKYFVLAIIFLIFVPSQNLLYIAVGYNVGKDVVENVSGTEEYKKVKEILNIKLDEILNESKNKESGEKR